MNVIPDPIPTPLLSTGQPSTLGVWRDMTFALLGEGPAVQFLDEKIAEQGRDEPVLSDERQMILLLVTMDGRA